jgi:hypothetical protein
LSEPDYFQMLESDGLNVLLFGGRCPVQVEATLPDGNYLYFRARGDGWTIGIATTDSAAIDCDPDERELLYYREGNYPSSVTLRDR